MIPNSRRAAIGRTRRKLERGTSAEHDRRHPPWLQVAIDFDDLAVPVEEYDVDRKAHEEHMHPHHGREPAIFEPHPGAGFKAVTTEQAAALAAKTARILEPLAEHGAASLIQCPNEIRHRLAAPSLFRTVWAGLSPYIIM